MTTIANAPSGNKATPVGTDKFPISGDQYVNLSDLLKIINDLTEDTAPASDADYWVTYDASAGAPKKVKLINLVNGMTEDTNPDEAADFMLSYDTSAGALKKVKPNNISFTAGAGTPVQVVHTQTGAVATGTTTVPWDDTIPQNTEGDQYMTLAITPTSATNKLYIESLWNGTSNAAGQCIMALFQDSTANALAASDVYSTSGGTPLNCVLSYEMTAGTTSSTTFKIRFGNSSAGTTTFNGSGGARKLGGVMNSYIRITEVKV